MDADDPHHDARASLVHSGTALPRASYAVRPASTSAARAADRIPEGVWTTERAEVRKSAMPLSVRCRGKRWLAVNVVAGPAEAAGHQRVQDHCIPGLNVLHRRADSITQPAFS